MKTISIAAVMSILIAAVAVAEPPVKYADWAKGPVSHLMTPQEKANWEKVSTEQEAEDFIALFWAKRDPTPATALNELKVEFDKRVELSDQFFTTKRTRGAMTDRGHALILLGSPFNVGSSGAESGAPKNPNISSIDAWDGSVGGPRGRSAMMTWTYANDKKPAFINRKDFELLFVDDQGDGQWQFAKTTTSHPEIILAEAVQALIISPDLTKAPVYSTTPATSVAPTSFRTVGLKDACDQFRAEGKSSEGPGKLSWGEFVTPEGEVFVPVQLFMPAGSGVTAGQTLTFFGVVENESGQVVNVQEDEMKLAASGRDAYVEKSLLLPPGTYKATFGLADAGKVLTMTATEMKVDDLDPKESAISDLILSNNAYPLKEAQKMTDPFAFGGFKVVPKSDGVFKTSDEITYFYELRNPGVGEAGAPKVQAKILIEGKTTDDKPVRLNFPIQEFPLFALPGVANHYGLAMTFPLKDFKPGQYSVKIKVIDTILKKSYEASKPFEVQSSEG